MALPILRVQGKYLNASACFVICDALVLRLGLIITITTLITTLATEIRHLGLVNGSLKPIMAQPTNQVDMVQVHMLLALVDTVSNPVFYLQIVLEFIWVVENVRL